MRRGASMHSMASSGKTFDDRRARHYNFEDVQRKWKRKNETTHLRPSFLPGFFFKIAFASDVYPDSQHFVSNALRLIRHKFLKCARKDNVSKQTQSFEQMRSFLSLALMRVLCSRRANFVSRSASAWFLFYRNEGFHECRYMEMCVCR